MLQLARGDGEAPPNQTATRRRAETGQVEPTKLSNARDDNRPSLPSNDEGYDPFIVPSADRCDVVNNRGEASPPNPSSSPSTYLGGLGLGLLNLGLLDLGLLDLGLSRLGSRHDGGL